MAFAIGALPGFSETLLYPLRQRAFTFHVTFHPFTMIGQLGTVTGPRVALFAKHSRVDPRSPQHPWNRLYPSLQSVAR